MNKIFIDTSYFISLFVKKDFYHEKSKEIAKKIRNTSELWTHEGIILEIGDWFSTKNRELGLKSIEIIYSSQVKVNVVKLDSELLLKSLELYKKYSDKTVGLTDCVSFNVMWDNQITSALTSDKHFIQVGFKALLLDD